MNCQECRTHLHPFLDSEIEVKDNLAILEHVNACAACRDLFDSEERCWTHVREVLRRDRVPPEFVACLPELLLRDVRSQWIRRIADYLSPIAAAAAVVLAFLLVERFTHEVKDHGPGIRFAVEHYLGLADEAGTAHKQLIDPDLLRIHSEGYAELEGEALQRFYVQLFGAKAKLPPEITRPRVAGAALQVGFHGTPVSNLILDLQDMRIGVYRLTREQAGLLDLKLIDDGTTTGLRIERCKGCHVIAITRGDTVYVLVSKDGVDPLIQLMRQTF